MQILWGWVLIAVCAMGGVYGGILVKDGFEKARTKDRGSVTERPFLNIQPFKYTNTSQYFSIEEMNSKTGEFVLQFQIEIHNVGKYIAKDIEFLKCEVRGPHDQSIDSSEPIVSSDLGPDAKYYPKFNLVVVVSPANFRQLPSGQVQLIHNFSTIQFDVVLKYASDISPKTEYQIDASYRISADSVEILRYKVL